MTDDVNARLAKILGFPENVTVTRADIRMRPLRAPEIDITYFIDDENNILKEIEARFKLVEIVGSDED